MNINNNKMHLLVIDDDTRIRNLLAEYLRQNNFLISQAVDGKEALELATSTKFDLIIVDVMMPVKNGIDFSKEIRKTQDVPIIMLTALSELPDRIKGLQTGVDDYITKPFDPQELLLRINAVLRRTKREDTLSLGKLSLHIKPRELHIGETIIRLTHRELSMLLTFFQNPNEIITREKLAKEDDSVNTRTVDVQITRLRKKIEKNAEDPIWLKTVRGAGYMLKASETT